MEARRRFALRPRPPGWSRHPKLHRLQFVVERDRLDGLTAQQRACGDRRDVAGPVHHLVVGNCRCAHPRLGSASCPRGSDVEHRDCDEHVVVVHRGQGVRPAASRCATAVAVAGADQTWFARSWYRVARRRCRGLCHVAHRGGRRAVWRSCISHARTPAGRDGTVPRLTRWRRVPSGRPRLCHQPRRIGAWRNSCVGMVWIR